LQLYNLSFDCAIKLFKPLKEMASLLVCNEKNLGFGFFVGVVIGGIGLQAFWLRLWIPGPQLQEGSVLINFSGN